MNVILIMEDSFRRDHLGCYGNKWIKTPNIDKFASQSVIFDYAYAEGLPTIPVRISLFTGRYTLPFRGWQPVEQLDMPISEILWDKGFTTALISDTYHMHKPQMGFSRGFDYVEWIRGQENDPWAVDPNLTVDLTKYSEKNWYPAYPGQPERIVKKQFEQYLKDRAHWKSEEDHHIAQVMRASMRWLQEKVSNGYSDRLFLVIDSFDPHEPWDPPVDYLDMYPVPEYDGLPITWGGGFIDGWTLSEIRHIRAQYAGTVTMTDKWTGILLEKIQDLGLLDNTMIIFITDHGEPFGEHGIIKKVQPWPYEELSHIPLIIRFPDKMAVKNKRVGDFAGIQDVSPTVLDFFNIKIPDVMQGKSLLPLVQGGEGMKFGISGFYERSWSTRNHERSFYLWLQPRTATGKDKPEMYKYDPDFVPPEPAKYELERDQAERRNLYEEDRAVADPMEKELRSYVTSLLPSSGDLMSKDFMKRQIAYRPPPKT